MILHSIPQSRIEHRLMKRMHQELVVTIYWKSSKSDKIDQQIILTSTTLLLLIVTITITKITSNLIINIITSNLITIT